MQMRVEGIAGIRPRCESEQGEQGCEMCKAHEICETSEWGCVSNIKRGRSMGSASADLTSPRGFEF